MNTFKIGRNLCGRKIRGKKKISSDMIPLRWNDDTTIEFLPNAINSQSGQPRSTKINNKKYIKKCYKIFQKELTGKNDNTDICSIYF